ncbi:MULTISPECIES: hypothetical protein [unclassified Lysinibacillus]|uniref:hypothetical protein n=1 Tax=unclassified Lysinibacillus TaxID=2636778 RepID=UPI00201B3F2C|nr:MULTISPECIES: hypothetical protein [unclassified Lysinibacillus]
MVPLKKITKARTSRELERMIEDDKERGWNVASKVNHFPYHSRPYQVLMTFKTDNEQVSL